MGEAGQRRGVCRRETAGAAGGERGREKRLPPRELRPAGILEVRAAADDLLRPEATGYVEGREARAGTKTGRRYCDRVRVCGDGPAGEGGGE